MLETWKRIRVGSRVHLVRTVTRSHAMRGKFGTVIDLIGDLDGAGNPVHDARIDVAFDGCAHDWGRYFYFIHKFDLVPPVRLRAERLVTRGGHPVTNVKVSATQIRADVDVSGRILRLHFLPSGHFIEGHECPVDLLEAP